MDDRGFYSIPRRLMSAGGRSRNGEAERAEPIEIPPAELSVAALRGVAEAFVLREGTDYGERTFSFEEKVRQVLDRIARGEARVFYHPDSRSVELVAVAP